MKLIDSNLFSIFFDHINEGVYILDSNGDYIYCNHAFCKMTCATLEQIQAMNAFNLVKDGIVKKSVAITSFQTKKKTTMINNVVTYGNYKYKQMATATPILDDSGNIVYMVVEMVILENLNADYQLALLDSDKTFIDESVGDNISSLVCHSSQMKNITKIAKNIALTDSTIMVTGETGVGKEVLVNFIHNNSNRRNNKLVAINCSAIPENLLESELFGYEKGSFTGALANGKAGLIEDANGGTLFLDEINSIPIGVQIKLLRVLETKKCKRIGSINEKYIDFRLITATNVDLKKSIEDGTFRRDLYYRINVISLDIPPLRERISDIVPLSIYFSKYFCEKLGIVRVISKEVFNTMLAYKWPGNVRELKNFIERLITLSYDGSIEIEKIPDGLLSDLKFDTNDTNTINIDNNIDIWKSCYEYNNAGFSLKTYLEKCESDLLKEILYSCKSTYKTAKVLNINQSTVERKKQKYNITY